MSFLGLIISLTFAVKSLAVYFNHNTNKNYYSVALGKDTKSNRITIINNKKLEFIIIIYIYIQILFRLQYFIIIYIYYKFIRDFTLYTDSNYREGLHEGESGLIRKKVLEARWN